MPTKPPSNQQVNLPASRVFAYSLSTSPSSGLFDTTRMAPNMSTLRGPRDPTSNHPKRVGASKTETLLAVSDTIVSTLKDVGAWSGLPFIQEAAGVALTILTMIQNVRQNKKEFRRLGNDACEITYAAALMCNEYQKRNQAFSKRTEKDLEELVRKLKEIERYACENTQRKWYWAWAHNKSDLDTIAGYRQDLNSSVALFGFQSNLTIREAVARLEQQGSRIERQQKQILQELKDQEVRKSEEGRPTTWPGEAEAPDRRQRQQGTIRRYGSPSARITSSPGRGFGNGDFVDSPSSPISFTAIAGNKVHTNNSRTIMNTNSGNTHTTTISGSNNDHSVRYYGHQRRGLRK